MPYCKGNNSKPIKKSIGTIIDIVDMGVHCVFEISREGTPKICYHWVFSRNMFPDEVKIGTKIKVFMDPNKSGTGKYKIEVLN